MRSGGDRRRAATSGPGTTGSRKSTAVLRPRSAIQSAEASTTDPEARFMRMPDGGTRPAYNVQLAADTESRAIVGVE